MKAYQKTKVCYAETQGDGSKKSFITSETAFNKMVKDATEAKEALPEQVAIGSFSYKAAETVDEAVQLAGGSGVGQYENIEIFLGVFNYAAGLRQDNAANDLLQSDSYEQQEGLIDVSFAVAQKAERAKMSPEERAIKDLAKGGIVVTADQLRAALALIQEKAATA